VRIPAADDGGKQGIDDFIVAAGPGAFHKLLEEAEDPEPIDPGTLKADAKDADPADVARRFLSKLTVNCHIRLRWWLGGWWYWSNGCYSEVSDDDIKAKVTAFMADEYFKVKIDHVNNVLLHIRSQSLVDSLTKAPKWLGVESKFAADECFVTRNGVVHLPSMVRSKPCFEQSDPSLFNMVCGDFEFDSDAPRPERWHKFLDDLFGDDDQSKRLLQSWFGYCLLPQTNLQKFLLILGPKRSGKGTLARVLQAMLGERSVAAPTLSSLATNFGLQPLVGKTLAIISDARLSGRTDQGVVVERLLSITGEDLQTIDRKHRESVSTKLPTRFMVMTNELPRLADASGALVGRMLLLHTPRSFYGNEQVDLSDQLIEELPGIFRWAAVGWANLQQARRFVQPDSSLELLGQMQDLSSPVSEFLRECCVVGPEYSVPVDDLYERWRRWCEASGKARATDKATFGRDVMAAAGVVKRRVRSGDDRRYEYFGVDLQAELNGVCP
jgi:putative DNA primase/helicase